MIHDALSHLAVPIDSLTELPGNPRRGDVDAVAASLARFGQRKPIVVRASDRTITAGNHTFKAARQLGWDEIAAVLLDDDEATAAAFALADNRTSDLGDYDEAALLDLIRHVGELDPTLLTDAGWSTDAVTDLVARIEADLPTPPADADDVPETPADPVTKPGDVWLLGEHRVICGDCRDPATVERLLAGATINLAFTSPPYADRRIYDVTSGFLPVDPDAYVEWFAPVAANVAAHLAEDGSWFVNIKPGVTPDGDATELYVFDLVLAHARTWGWHFATEFCWERIGVPKNVTRRFKNQFEPVYQFTRGGRWKMRPDDVRHASDNVLIPGGPGVGNTGWADAQGGNGAMFGGARRVENGLLSDHGREKQGTGKDRGPRMIASGMAYPGNRLPTFASSHSALGHTAAFPVGLPTFFTMAYTDPGDAVYDPFMGSGSTLIAAHDTGRRAYGAEISPAYVDVIAHRWQVHTGGKPILESTGEPHDFAEVPA